MCHHQSQLREVERDFINMDRILHPSRSPRTGHPDIHAYRHVHLDGENIKRPIHTIRRRQRVTERRNTQATDTTLLDILTDPPDFGHSLRGINNHRWQNFARVLLVRLRYPVCMCRFHD